MIGVALIAMVVQAGVRPWRLSSVEIFTYEHEFGQQQQQQMSFSLQGEGLRAATSPFVDRLGPTSRDKWSMPLSQHAVRLSIMYPCRLRSRHRLSRWRSPPYNGSAILSSKEKPHPDPMQNTRGVFFSRASNFQDGVSIQLTDEARVFPAACCA